MIYGRMWDVEENWKQPRRWFAWHPVRLDDGRKAWLEHVERYFWDDPDENWAGGDSRTRYRPLVDGCGSGAEGRNARPHRNADDATAKE
jgi:hypothetical protein